MAEVEISYKGSNIATMNASGTKTLLTEAKYLEDDVTVTYTRPSAPSGTKNISITQNGTTTEDVTNYASAQITANVPNTYSAGDEGKVVSNGALVEQGSDTVTQNDTYDTTLISSLTVNVSGGGGFTLGQVAEGDVSGEAVISGTSVVPHALAYLSGVTSIKAPNLEELPSDAFRNMGTLGKLKFPKVTAVTGGNALNSSNPTVVYMPLCTDMSSNVGTYGIANGTLACPRLSTIATGDSFRYNRAVIMDLGVIQSLPTRALYQGYVKQVLILRYTGGVVSASASNAISNIDGNSKVYVPQALISSYQSASGWSSKGNIFYALEGSDYEQLDWADWTD